MEAATSTRTRTAKRAAASDRELALRLGSLMLCSFGSNNGSVIRAIDESGIGFTQMKALVSLAGHDEEQAATVKDVAEELGISLASASRAVEGLVKRDLASRSEDPTDRRVRRVALTADGQEIADELMAARLAGLEEFIDTLSGEERRRLEGALEVLMRREDIAGIYRRHRKRVVR